MIFILIAICLVAAGFLIVSIRRDHVRDGSGNVFLNIALLLAGIAVFLAFVSG